MYDQAMNESQELADRFADNSGKPVTGEDLRRALDALLAGRAVDASQKPSVGCSIKWER